MTIGDPVRPTSPSRVAALRGLLYAGITAAIAVVIAATPADLSVLGPATPVVVLVARWGEAMLLDRKQPPQAGPLGGKPAL